MFRYSQTNRARYKKHQYSGPPKSITRVRAQLAKVYGEGTTRKDVWRAGERKTVAAEPAIEEKENMDSNNFQNSVKTYRKVTKIDQSIPTNIEPVPSTSLHPPVPADKRTPLEINWPQPDAGTESHQLIVEGVPDDRLSGLTGYRIVDIPHVIQWVSAMERHRTKCSSSQIEFVGEVRDGFHSTFKFKCTMCDKEWKHSNEKYDTINTSFVWGTITAGSYYTQSSQITNLMDIPTMSGNKFRRIEKGLNEVWQDHLTHEIEKAGQEEREIALAKGQVSSDGVAYTKVYVDGGWLKRSYGHNFDSPSGMACIIGKETKKCLFIGVRNKYCFTCQYYERKNMEPKAHVCFKNFTGPSTAMESEIIVEGFQKSEEMHQLRYLFFIGDGDSSVFAKLREKVSYGRQIKKIECKNHVVKNYTSALYKILANTKLPIIGRNILKPRLTNLTLVTRKIIIKNSENPSSMAEDLRNGPAHVFGVHEKCKQYYCKWKKTANEESATEQDQNLVEKIKSTAPDIWALIYAANEKVALKAGRLSNETTNIAENFMSVINKFTCGKRISLGRGGSYQRRVQVAGLTQIAGHKWQTAAWKKKTLHSPGKTFKRFIEKKETSKIRQQSTARKRLFTGQVKTQPDQHYGPNASDLVDIDEGELRKHCEERLKEFPKSSEEIASIALATVGQHDNDLYNTHRNDRLTASQFGMVCKRRQTTHCHNHVKNILYKSNICTKDMLYGQQNEIVARSKFMQLYDKVVRPAGLYIDEEFGFLAGSPDGIIEAENALVEIKCFPSLARSCQDLATAANEKKNFPIKIENGIMKLNEKHDYYYQVQGQLRVTKLSKCYFICFISLSEPLTVIEVERNEEFITRMLPKLVTFFKDCVLPEIVLRQVEKNGRCIDLKEFKTDKNQPSTSSVDQPS